MSTKISGQGTANGCRPRIHKYGKLRPHVWVRVNTSGKYVKKLRDEAEHFVDVGRGTFAKRSVVRQALRKTEKADEEAQPARVVDKEGRPYEAARHRRKSR